MKPQTTPKDFFLYLAMIVTLYVSAGSVIRLWFEIINALFPDALAGYHDPFSGAIRFAIAALVIVFPVYLVITSWLAREVARMPEKRDLGIRKWLIYFTLFLAGVIIVGDLIVVLNTFLGGELTARFVFKAVAVFIIAGGIFGGYGYALYAKKPAVKIIRSLFILAGVFALASVVAGFSVLGSPNTQRALRFDDRRVSDLMDIQWRIVSYWQQKGVLPNELQVLTDSISGFVVPTDPATGFTYEYERHDRLAFSLCATFERDGKPSGANRFSRPTPAFPDGNSKGLESLTWNHSIGRQCFRRAIDPDLYPVHEKVRP